MATLKELVKETQENFDTIEDIFLSYQNDIYRAIGSEEHDDLKKYINDLKTCLKNLDVKADMLAKDAEQAKAFKNIQVLDKSQWKNSKRYNNNNDKQHSKKHFKNWENKHTKNEENI